MVACVGRADWRRGLVLNGTSEYADFGTFNALDSLTEFSVSIWCDISGAINRKILCQRSYGSTGWFIGTPNEGGVVYAGYGNGAAYPVIANVSITTGWHLLTLVYTDSFGLSLYIDGVYRANIQSGTISFNNDKLQIGRQDYAATAYWDSGVCAPLIWNRGLSPAEVLGLYNETTAVTNEGASVEVPRAWVNGTNSLLLDLDIPETWDTGDTVTNGTLMVNNGSASGTATITGTPDVSSAVQVPSPHR